MKNSLFLLFAAAAFTISCNNESKESPGEVNNTDSSKPVETKIPEPVSTTTCYSGKIGKDTMQLQLTTTDGIAAGTLVYKRNKKDNNSGNLTGKLRGDTLLADYTFMSEGQQSVREVIFLIKDSTATEGYGDVEEKDGKMVFKNPSKIPFEKGLVMNKIPCN